MPPPQPSQSPTFSQQLAFTQWLMQFPALSVMVFLRRDLGYRLLNPLSLIGITAVMLTIAVLAEPGEADTRPGDLLVFALLAFFLGFGQRLQRWREVNRHVRQHSYYLGTSPFDFAWLPAFSRRNRRVARFADPLFCVLAGLLLFQVSRLLAMWLVGSGVCLRVFEYIVHQRERNLNLDMVDSLLLSEKRGLTVERFEGTQTDGRPQSAAAVPTGLGTDVQEQIARRKTKPNP